MCIYHEVFVLINCLTLTHSHFKQMALQRFEQHAAKLIVNIIALTIIIFIFKATYNNMYIKPTLFIKKLAGYSAFCGLLSVIFDLINNTLAVIFFSSDKEINLSKYRYDDKNIIYFQFARDHMAIFANFFYFSLIINVLQLQRQNSKFIRDSMPNKLFELCKIANILITFLSFLILLYLRMDYSSVTTSIHITFITMYCICRLFLD